MLMSDLDIEIREEREWDNFEDDEEIETEDAYDDYRNDCIKAIQ